MFPKIWFKKCAYNEFFKILWNWILKNLMISNQLLLQLFRSYSILFPNFLDSGGCEGWAGQGGVGQRWVEQGKGKWDLGKWGKGKWGKCKRGKVEGGRAREGWPAKIPSFIIIIIFYHFFPRAKAPFTGKENFMMLVCRYLQIQTWVFLQIHNLSSQSCWFEYRSSKRSVRF